MGTPFFPYDGTTFFIETEGDQQDIENFVKNDPYVKSNLVSQYEIKEFDITMKKRFDRAATEFLLRS